MGNIYKVGIEFEFEPDGEHDFLFEDMSEADRIAEMVRLVNQDIFSNNIGTVRLLGIEREGN